MVKRVKYLSFPVLQTADVPVVDARARHLLKTLIERYIQEGVPVGSRQLVEDAGLPLSAATVRHVMADLEEIGLLASPHTSAGRVPTSRGYRMFVDTLLQSQSLAPDALKRLAQQLGVVTATPEALAQSASKLLSSLTRLTGFVRVPKRSQFSVRQIDFVALSGQRVLVILVLQNGQVENRIIHLEKPIAKTELVRTANYFNQRYAGLQLAEVSRRIAEELMQVHAEMNLLLRKAMELSQSVLSEGGDEVVIAGEFNLLDQPDLNDIAHLRGLMQTLHQKQDLLDLLGRCDQADGIRVFIGEESGYAALHPFSMVTAPYQVDGQVLGVVGVIGPTRMAYQQIIPLVDCTAHILSDVLRTS